MANINNLKIGANDPDAIMFNTYYAPFANQGVTFSELIPKIMMTLILLLKELGKLMMDGKLPLSLLA